MPKFRKKPVVIEAVQFTGDNLDEIALLSHGDANRSVSQVVTKSENYLEIYTLEGKMRGDIKDWIIKGISGEVYPCKPDIFDLTYEAVTE